MMMKKNPKPEDDDHDEEDDDGDEIPFIILSLCAVQEIQHKYVQ